MAGYNGQPLKVKLMKIKFVLELEWTDKSNVFAEISLEGQNHEVMAVLMWISRGALMASNADRAIVWNDEGFEVCAYQR